VVILELGRRPVATEGAPSSERWAPLLLLQPLTKVRRVTGIVRGCQVAADEDPTERVAPWIATTDTGTAADGSPAGCWRRQSPVTQLALEAEQSAVVPMLMARQVPVVHALAPSHALTPAAVGRALASATASSGNASM